MPTDAQNDTPLNYSLGDGFRRAGTPGKVLYVVTLLSGLIIVPGIMEFLASNDSRDARHRHELLAKENQGRLPPMRHEPELAQETAPTRSFAPDIAAQREHSGATHSR